jgi:excisionase family DNA binding protein
MADKFYTTGQAAKAAGVSRQTLHAWIDSDKVEAPAMIGGTRVWTQAQVNKLKKVPRRSSKR